MPDPKVNIEVRVDGAQAQDALGKVEAGLKQIRAESGEAAGALNQARKEIVGAGTDGAKAAEKLADAKREVAGVGSEGKKTRDQLGQARQSIGGVAVESAAAAVAVGGLRTSFGGLLASIPGVSAGLGVVASVAGAAAAAFAGLKKSINEYAAAEEGVSKMAAALGQTGQLTRENVERFQELASELQKTTAIADDEWIGVLTKLVQFGAKPESIGLHADAVKNLAGIVGDLGTATTMYAKALQGSYESFSRYGIVVSEAANQTQKLEQLWAQLADRGAGQLEAAARSLAGQFRGLKLATSDMFEAFGQTIARTGVLQWSLRLLTEAATSVAESIGEPAREVAGLVNRVREAAVANREYESTLKQIAIASEKVSQATSREVAAIRQRQQAIDEVADAQMALDLARVDEAQSSGKITPRQGIAQRSKIRRDYAKARFDREQEADIKEQESLESEFNAQSQLLEAVRVRRKNAGTVPQNGPIRTIGSDAQTLVADLKREKQERAETGRALNWLAPFVPAGFRGLMWRESIAAAQRMSEINRQIPMVEALGARGPATVAAREAEAAKLREEESVLEKRVNDARDRALGSGIPQRMAVRSVKFGIDAEREGITTRGEMTTAAKGEAEKILSGGGQAGAAAAQLGASMQALTSTLISNGQVLNRAVDAMSTGLDEVRTRLSAMEARNRNAANK